MNLMKQAVLLILLAASTNLLAQARDTEVRPPGRVTLEEFRQAISDESRNILLRTTADSLVGPIRMYKESKFYLEDFSSIDRRLGLEITEHWTYSNRGALYGAIGAVAIGAIVSAIILSRGSGNNGDGSNSQGRVIVTGLLIGGTVSLALPGLIIGAIIGSHFERGYHFPITSLEEE